MDAQKTPNIETDALEALARLLLEHLIEHAADTPSTPPEA
jgi:hypothetical protein